MKFSVQNLGRLAEATIDLDKDLILFVGPNNTSKTYVTNTIFGFISQLQEMMREPIYKILHSTAKKSHNTLVVDFEEVTKQFDSIKQNLAGEYRSRLADVLSANEDFTSNTTVSLTFDLPNPNKLIQDLIDDPEFLGNAITGDVGELQIVKKPNSSKLIFKWLPTPLLREPEDNKFLVHIVSSFFSGFFATLILEMTNSNALILPAERAAIQLFGRELSRSRSQLVDGLLARASRKRASSDSIVAALKHDANRYPAGIRAYLNLTDDLAAMRKNASEFAHMADQLDRLMGGALSVDDDGNTQFQPSSDAPPFHLHLASSSVKSLAGLSFYLRHLLKKGDFLFIDEPELNLHPDNQRRVARVLARLARGGVKVLVSTHSDYVIRELNNLIMLSADESGVLRDRLGYAADETLQPSQVGAYLFDQTHARRLEVAPTGIEVETIDNEINALNKISQDIYFSLFNNIAD